jgi:hypothetical protein
MSSIINQQLSLYIPRVIGSITEQFIIQYFTSQNIGKVIKVDFIKIENKKKDGKTFNSVYIHFEEWFQSENAILFQQEIYGPNKQIKVVYDGPWYWYVLENVSKKKLRIGGGGEGFTIEMQVYLEKLRQEEEERQEEEKRQEKEEKKVATNLVIKKEENMTLDDMVDEESRYPEGYSFGPGDEDFSDEERDY